MQQKKETNKTQVSSRSIMISGYTERKHACKILVI